MVSKRCVVSLDVDIASSLITKKKPKPKHCDDDRRIFLKSNQSRRVEPVELENVLSQMAQWLHKIVTCTEVKIQHHQRL